MSSISEILNAHEGEILEAWVSKQLSRPDLKMRDGSMRNVSRKFLLLLSGALQSGQSDTSGPAWTAARELLAEVSHTFARQGYGPAETAQWVFSLKEPLFARIRQDCTGKPEVLADATWEASTLIDSLGLYTAEVYQRGREELIQQQRMEMLELSTPVIRLWEGVLALPLIGTLDSERTQTVMENLLEEILRSGAGIAIIDITGVPTVDTLVAQHLLKTVAAARLMGAECIISGIRPQIAQTIVHLGVALGDVVTKATMADAFGVALDRLGLTVVRRQPAQA
jgi:rsbT co-antagonist protein RsbR